jgi:hypothetical protein
VLDPTRELSASMALCAVSGLLFSFCKWMRLTVVMYQLIYYCKYVCRRLTLELRTAAVDCHVSFGCLDKYRLSTLVSFRVTTIDFWLTSDCRCRLSIVSLHFIASGTYWSSFYIWLLEMPKVTSRSLEIASSFAQGANRNTCYSRGSVDFLCITIYSS